ncbi:MAG: SRPBCC domain-containing protein [Alphaproteobacteria bacterium]|nr:SRPBCC domain-containing protein [Alphaproteobacteria bacterium]MBU1527339.1 SRPBCC domain-containing protein [Alphaproteobacteria bacterium]MBU2118176.1 SRPBCC domain-containing protein [Alphaproteobacteria bacterium]MBU2352339.1 SRPBCC domain-containing protein [Alphaproteobacteria bacterium]MBU2382926.1 SRPBCC domain-containing protein [Alphaproteobacteria bacterium]
MTDFAHTVRVACSSADAFAALTRSIDHWWSREFEGRADAVGAEFTVRFDATFKTFRVVEMEPNAGVTWQCVASHLDLAGLDRRSEWDGTQVRWTLRPERDATLIDVTHIGLTPMLGCHDACTQGWEQFLAHSLVPYLESGEGRPFEAAVGVREDAA